MWYLCHFLHRHLDFRRSDLESVAALLGYAPKWQEPPGGNPLSPFWRVWLPDDEAARRVMGRSMLLKASGSACNLLRTLHGLRWRLAAVGQPLQNAAALRTDILFEFG